MYFVSGFRFDVRDRSNNVLDKEERK